METSSDERFPQLPRTGRLVVERVSVDRHRDLDIGPPDRADADANDDPVPVCGLRRCLSFVRRTQSILTCKGGQDRGYAPGRSGTSSPMRPPGSHALQI